MKTLICLGGMPQGERTVRFGGLVAALEESEVTLLTAVAMEEEIETGQLALKEARRLLRPRPVKERVVVGQPVPSIIAEAATGHYDRVVVGSRDVAGPVSAFVHSITRQVAEKAPTSVLVVKGAPPGVKRMLICSSGHPVSEPVIEAGARLAQLAGAEVTLLHVTGTVPAMYAGLEAMVETLPALLHTDTPLARHLRWSADLLARFQVPAEVRLHQGQATDEILHLAHQGHYDLVVLGAHADVPPWVDLFLVKVTPQIVDRSPASLLVVRAPEAGRA